MPYYHATTVDRLDSIARRGLGGVDTGPRSLDCERGVYLAESPAVALAMVLEHFVGPLEAVEANPHLLPRDVLRAIRVLVVDDARIDAARLAPDPHTDGAGGTWLYAGVIDVSAMPALTVADVLAAA